MHVTYLKQLGFIVGLLFQITGGQAVYFNPYSSPKYIFHLDDILQNKVFLNSHSLDTPFCPPNQPLPIVTEGNTILLQANGTFRGYSLSWYDAVSRGRNNTIDEVMYASDAQPLEISQVGSNSILGATKVPRHLRRGSVYMIYGLMNDVHEEQSWILPLCLNISPKGRNAARHAPLMATPGRNSQPPKMPP